jgi:hypothetical protein
MSAAARLAMIGIHEQDGIMLHEVWSSPTEEVYAKLPVL